MMTRSWPNGRRASCGACDSATGPVPGLHRMTCASRTRRGTCPPAPSLCGQHFSRFGRAIGHLVGGQDYHDRMRTATFAREALERSEELKRDWNRQVERAAEEGVHVIYTDGYDRLHKELDSVAGDMLLDRGVKSEISAVLAQIGKVVSNRNYFDNWPKLMAGQMDRREALAAKAAERGVAVPDHEDYDTWRNVTDFAVGRCEGLMDDPVNYGIHLDYIAHAESLGSALTRVRDVLEDDDRHLAATLAGQRAGESLQMRDERVARLLDDPEKFRELRQQRAERKAGQQQSRTWAGIGACESSRTMAAGGDDRDSRRSYGRRARQIEPVSYRSVYSSAAVLMAPNPPAICAAK